MSAHKNPHPGLPFITVEKQVAEKGETGWNEWRYSIQDLCTYSGFRSEHDAREAAEEELFSHHDDYVERKLSSALDRADLELALAIAHHRGQWLGAVKHKAKIAENLKRAVEYLEPLLR